jgi:hypothetical protein
MLMATGDGEHRTERREEQEQQPPWHDEEEEEEPWLAACEQSVR